MTFVKRLFLFVSMILILVAVVIGPASAQTISDPKAWSETFFRTLLRGGPEEAFSLLAGSNLVIDNPGIIERFVKGYNENQRDIGKAIDYDFLRKQTLGSRTIRLLYVVNSELKTTQYKIVFYRPKSQWLITSFFLTSVTDSWIWDE